MLATIEKITNIHKHSNADTLQICLIKGWQTIIKLDSFKENELVIYIYSDGTRKKIIRN